MPDLLNAAQMRAIEQEAISSGRVTGLTLMERAGQGVVAAIEAEWPELVPCQSRAVVLCGPGNNGGDGFVIARLLAARGWDVEVFLYGDPERLPPDARVNFDRWEARAGRPACSVDYVEIGEWCDAVVAGQRGETLWVDALFGIGLSRPLPAEITRISGFIAEGRGGQFARLVAVDVPSGLNADTGEALGASRAQIKGYAQNGYSFDGLPVIAAALTVTFHAPKAGHVAGDGPVICGKVVVKDIGL